jgi:hypothetical protein
MELFFYWHLTVTVRKPYSRAAINILFEAAVINPTHNSSPLELTVLHLNENLASQLYYLALARVLNLFTLVATFSPCLLNLNLHKVRQGNMTV